MSTRPARLFGTIRYHKYHIRSFRCMCPNLRAHLVLCCCDVTQIITDVVRMLMFTWVIMREISTFSKNASNTHRSNIISQSDLILAQFLNVFHCKSINFRLKNKDNTILQCPPACVDQCYHMLVEAPYRIRSFGCALPVSNQSRKTGNTAIYRISAETLNSDIWW